MTHFKYLVKKGPKIKISEIISFGAIFGCHRWVKRGTLSSEQPCQAAETGSEDPHWHKQNFLFGSLRMWIRNITKRCLKKVQHGLVNNLLSAMIMSALDIIDTADIDMKMQDKDTSPS